MAYKPGLRNIANITSNQVFTSNVALATVGLIAAIAAGQTLKIRAWVPFSVGATGGVRLQLVVPAGGTIFNASIKLYNTVAPSLTTATQAASAAFTNALANAGRHWVEVDATIINGATAGNVDLQFAQNTSDALSLTVLTGGTMDVTAL